jgi:hypothetical protein
VKGTIMALGIGRDSNPQKATPAPAPAQKATPAPVEAEKTPDASGPTAKPMFSFVDADVPGRVTSTDTTADPEYKALYEKLANHWELVKGKKVGIHHGYSFPSTNVKRHVAFLRKAANEMEIGVAIRVNDEDKEANTGSITFRSKPRKQYDK